MVQLVWLRTAQHKPGWDDHSAILGLLLSQWADAAEPMTVSQSVSGKLSCGRRHQHQEPKSGGVSVPSGSS
jgi:hypothetical protein